MKTILNQIRAFQVKVSAVMPIPSMHPLMAILPTKLATPHKSANIPPRQSTSQRRRFAWGIFSFGLASFLLATAGYGDDITGSNETKITINDNTKASPYESIIEIAGAPGVIADVRVTLKGLTHTYPADVSVMLVSPEDKSIVLMSSAGGGTDVSGLDITFSAIATSPMSSAELSSSVYLPSHLRTGTTFPSPAPSVPTITSLAGFNGGSPNGNWKLYVKDDVRQDIGKISSGWSLQVTTGYPPTFTTQPQSRKVNRGSSVTLTAAVNANPAATLQWRKNNVDLPGQTGASLTLANFQSVDAGSYSLFARNAYGEVTSSPAVLTLNELPTITPIADQAVNEDTSSGPLAFTIGDIETAPSDLTVSASSSNAALIPPSGILISGTGNNRAIALTPAANQFGTCSVTVVVSDGNGSSSRTFQITVNPVNDAPTITSIAPQTVNEDGVAGPLAFTINDIEALATNLTVEATSSNSALVPPAGFLIVGSGTSRTLTVTPSANGFGSATITLTVSDGILSTPISFLLTVNPVNDPPTLSSIPDQNISINQSTGDIAISVNDVETPAADLVLSATSNNGAILPPGSYALGGSGGARTLSLTPAAAQSGQAVVTVSLSDGTATSQRQFMLTVFAGPAITQQPVDRTIQTGGSATFSVSATGFPTPTYQWKKDDAIINGATSPSYTVTNAVFAPPASFTCVVTNSIGSVTSNPGILTVLSLPTIATQPLTQVRAVGSPVTFSVTPGGSPPFSYQWRKDGTPIPNATEGTFTIPSLILSDAANYSVVVSNPVGSIASNNAQLTVLVPPAIIVHPHGNTLPAEANINLTVTATGSPTLAYQWNKNNSPLAGKTAASLAISNISPADAGSYTVTVTNQVGTVTSDTAVIAIGPAVGTVWEWKNPLPTSHSMSSVAWGGGNYIACGPSDNIMTSVNGEDWELVPNAIIGGATYVFYDGSKFLAQQSASPYALLSSADGITWASVAGAPSLNAITREGSQLIGVGGNRISSSTNGTAWTQRFAGNPGPQHTVGVDSFQSIATGNGRYVAVGFRETTTDYMSYQHQAIYATSTNLINWTNTLIPNTSGSEFTGIAFGAGKFVAIQSSGYSSLFSILTSLDGVTWTSQAPLPATSAYYGIQFLNNKFLLHGTYSGYASIRTSPDGETWTAATMPVSGTEGSLVQEVASDGLTLTAVGTKGLLLSSSDGDTWLASRRGPTDDLKDAVVLEDGEIWAVGTNGRALRSADRGDTWLKVESGTNESFSKIAAGNGVVLLSSYAKLFRCADGQTFTEVPNVSSQIGNVSFCNGQFLLSSSGGLLWSSTDGLTWYSKSIGQNLYGKIIFVKDLYICHYASSSGTVVSRDLQTWMSTDSSSGDSIATDGNIILASGGSTGLRRSTDGLNWTNVPCDNAYGMRVAYGAGSFVTIGGNLSGAARNKIVATSPDGITWTTRTGAYPSAQQVSVLVYAASRFVAVGEYGSILTSASTERPPEFVMQPVGGVLTRGQSVTLSARAITHGPISYQWLKNGELIAGATGASITLANLTGNDAGAYSLRATSPSGTSTSNAAVIQIETSAAGDFSSTVGKPNLTKVIHTGTRFLAVGGSTLLGSSTGDTWSQSHIPTVSNTYKSIAYGAGKHVAVGSGGISASSSDAENWILRRSGTDSDQLNDIAFGNANFVAVGTGGRVATSSDGENFSVQVSGITNSLNAISYGNGLFVAVGSGGKIITSPDGVGWTNRTANVTITTTLNAVTYANGRWMIVGNSASYNGGTSSEATVLSSTDGITWTRLSSGRDYKALGLAGNNGSFVTAFDYFCLGQSASPYTSWSVGLSTTGTNIRFRALVFAGARYVAVGDSGIIATSPTGASGTWTYRNNGNGWLSVSSISHTGTSYFATSSLARTDSTTTGQILTSSDGANWSVDTSGMPAYRSIAYGNGHLVACGFGVSGAHYRNIAGGGAWQASTLAGGGSFSLSSVIFGNGIFVARESTYNSILYSTNGVSWSYSSGLTYLNGGRLAFGMGRFVLGSTGGKVFTSENGTSFKQWNTGLPVDLDRIAYGNGRFISLDSAGTTVCVSLDGIVWSALPLQGSIGGWNSLAFGNGQFFLITGGKLASSYDGVSWNVRENLNIPENPYYFQGTAFGFGPNRVLVFGDSISQAPISTTSCKVTSSVVAPTQGSTISPIGTGVVAPGSSLVYTATPDTYYTVDKWMVDGEVVQSGGLSYTLRNIQGDRTVIASFGFPQGLPQIIGGIYGETINEGQSRTFTVNHTGNPAPTYQWRKDGVDIPGATQQSYTIAIATADDAGSYTVVLTNSFGSTISTPAVLSVQHAPVIHSQPLGGSYLPGSNLKLTVAATAYPSSLTYQWRFNGADISGQTQSTFSILNFQVPDAGDYTVTVTNSYGSTTSAVAPLGINTRPDATRKPGSLDNSFRPNAIGFTQNSAYMVGGLIVESDGSVVVGGVFDSNDARQPSLTRLKPDGHPDVSFGPGAGFSGINSVARQSDGKYIVAGSFSSAKGSAAGRIARLNADGSLDSTFNIGGIGANGQIWSLSVDALDRIYIGGDFTTFNSQSRSRIARLDATGALDTGFVPGTGADGRVYVVLPQSTGEVLIGGSFGFYNGVTRKRIARLLSTGALDTGFAPLSTFSGTIYALHLQSDGKLIIGGDFSSVTSGISRGGLARLNTNGSHDASFGAASGTGFDTTVRSISAQSDGKLVIGGRFTSYNSVARPYLARVTADGSLESTFPTGNGPNAAVYVVKSLDNGDVLLGGLFTTVNDVGRDYVAKIDVTGTVVTGYGIGTTIGTSSTIYAVLPLPSGKVFAGGYFTAFNGNNAAGYVQLLADGSIDPTFAAGTNSSIAITAAARQPDGKVIYGTGSGSVIRLKTDGLVDPTFAVPTGGNGTIWAIQVQSDGSVLVGGDFSSFAGSTARRYLVRLTDAGVVDNTFAIGVGPNASVKKLAIQPDGKVLVGGSFPTFDGLASRAFLTRLLSSGAQDPDFDATVNGSVNHTGILIDGRIYLSGSFTTVDGQSRSYLARILETGEIDPDFTPPSDHTIASAPIAVQSNGKLVCGATELFRLNLDGSYDAEFYAGGSISAISTVGVSDDGGILIGGYFNIVSGVRRSSLARLYGDAGAQLPVIVTEPSAQFVALGENVNLSVVAVGSPSPVYQWRKNNVDLPGKTGASLSIENLQTGDLGDYSVVVSNLLGNVISQTATLSLNSPPLISELPNVTILRGQSIPGIPFAVSDDQTPSGSLGVSVQSSDPILLPLSGIMLGGTNEARTIDLSPVVGQTGQCVVTLTVGDGQLFTSRSFTLSVMAPSLMAWKDTFFTPEQRALDSVVGDFADPNNNGLVNLLEYALGGDPVSGSLPPMPSVSVIGGQASFTYVRPKGIQDIQYAVEYSSSGLAGWGTAPAIKISETETTETWQAVKPATGSGVFFRLKVQR